MKNLKLISFLLLFVILFNCSKEEDVFNGEENSIQENNSEILINRAGLKPTGAGVMIRTFYWDVSAGVLDGM